MTDELPTPYDNSLPVDGRMAPGDGALTDTGLDEENGGANLRRMFGAVWRYKWVIAVVTLVGTGLGVMAAQHAGQQYQAQGTVWISTGQARPGEGDPQPIQGSGLLSQPNAWVDLLKSWTVLDQVVREKRLYIEPASPADSALFKGFALETRFRPGSYILSVGPAGKQLTLKTSKGMVVERGPASSPIGKSVGFEWTPPANALHPSQNVQFTVRVPRAVSMQLAKDLQTAVDARNGNFLSVTLTQSSAAGAAGVLNAILDRYIAVATDLKKAKLDQLTKILADQLKSAEANLKQAEMALEEFRVHTITLPSQNASTPVTPGLQSTQDPVFTHFFNLKMQDAQLEQDRAAIDSVMKAGVTIDALQMIPSVRSSAPLASALQDLSRKEADLRALRVRYTDQNPLVKDTLAEVAHVRDVVIPQMLRSLNSDLAAKQREVQKLISQSAADLQEIPPRMIEEGRLKRRETIAENLYTTLQQRYSEAQLAEASSTPDVRILDRPVMPHGPVQNKKPRIILLALAASLGLAIAGAILRDRYDPRLRYPEQVTGLGLPILGVLPQLDRKAGRGSEERARQALEAFRTLRMNISNAHGTGPILLTVSSPGKGDGKSFVSGNLAASFADMGYRTLLIDGDIRRGALHRLFDVERKPGLIDHLAGQASVSAIVQPTKYRTLSFIGSGTRFSNGPELLGSRGLRELVLWARSEYQVVIMDSAPLGAGADAYMLATSLGNLVLVMRSGSTNREMAEAKLELLHRLPVRALGAILNAVPEDRSHAYYYSYHYLEGYHTEMEQADEAHVLPPPAAS